MNKQQGNEIYELKGVYGDEENFSKKPIRLVHMVNFVKNTKKIPKRILDIGCGTGYFSKTLLDIYPKAEIWGVDISQRALKEGSTKYKGVNFKYADAEEKLPFKNNYFDLIISGEHIEHIKDVDNYLIEVNRVAKKNGTLIVTTPNLGSWINRILLLFGLQPFYLEPSMRKTLPILTYFGKTFPENLTALPSGHLRLYTLNMLKKLLDYYGFQFIEAKGTFMLKAPLIKQVDMFFSNFPSLSYGLVVKLHKK